MKRNNIGFCDNFFCIAVNVLKRPLLNKMKECNALIKFFQMPNGNGNVTESKKDLYNSQNDMNNSLQFETESSNKGECYYC